MKINNVMTYVLFVLVVIITCITAMKNPFFYTNISSTDVSAKNNELLMEIKEKAKEYHVQPMDAYIDRVYKKTPRRNGRKVNIEKSYQNMKKSQKFTESLLVFDEISPSVSLKDLPASPIYRGHPEKEMVALLINVSWGTEYIPRILEVLKEQNVKATFFIEGKWAKENKNVVKMIHEQNHLIGNHAYNHPDMARISKEEMIKQIDQTNHILEAMIDYRPIWFAPPSGSFNDTVVKVAHDLNMETVLWTVDTIDWQKPSPEVMINRVMTKVHPGATILMHPTEPVALGLESLIDDIKHKKYRLGT